MNITLKGIFISGALLTAFAFKESSEKPISIDSIKRVNVTVFLKEKNKKVINYDSIFQATRLAIARPTPVEPVSNTATYPSSNSITFSGSNSDAATETFYSDTASIPSYENTADADSLATAVPADSALMSVDSMLLANEYAMPAEQHQTTQTAKGSYLTIGLVLLLAGVVFALMFGNVSLMISVAGVLFILIGFIIR
ncbi:hypothetical protein [Rubrolithibacter danxiaensis]|uniref:hypothetical protein n=1 Tax=Rubrolithibacter danxiaensis TaxID=3390805 RepID=UPI003BF83BBF